MIVAISQFRIANGLEAVVAAAFAQRCGLVDSQPGFLGLEVFTAFKDDALFYLITRWADELSFESWHNSQAHRDSRQAMPRGIKLDKAHTRLLVMNRIASGARAGGLEPIVADSTPFIAEFLRGAKATFFVEASADGALRAWNAAAADCFGAAQDSLIGASLWECFPEDEAECLRRRVASGERRPQERFTLKLRGAEQTFHCQLDLRPDGFVLLGEYAANQDDSLYEEMTRINNEVVELSRESARKGQALARALTELGEKNRALEQAYQRITELARTDALTEIFNRRYFDQLLATEMSRARRQGSPLVAMMVDLDHFKSVNDRYGHGVGDAVLVAAAAALKGSSRAHDIVARYGGEEFVVILPGTRIDDGVECAERLRSALAELKVTSYPHQLTASLGVAMLTQNDDSYSLLTRADEALYRAKQGGRNRVEAEPS